MTLSNYYTVKENGFHEIIIQKSRFITYLARATTEEQAQAFISELKKNITMRTITAPPMSSVSVMRSKKRMMTVNRAERPVFRCLKY